MRIGLQRPNWQTSVVIVFFALLLGVGWVVHRDYGVSADEPTMLRLGMDAFAYLFKGGPEPTLYDWTFHNPIVSVAMVAVQRLLYGEAAPAPEVWYLRHWLTFLLLFLTIVIFYRIALRLRVPWWMALFGCVFFVVSPRMFAHGMYNPKDIPALLLFTAAMFTLFRLRDRPAALGRLLFHALLCALLISVRNAVGLFPVLLTFWILGGWRRSGIFLAATALLTIAVWPRLWGNPFSNVIMAFTDNASRGGGGLYFGQVTQGNPWHYIPVWIVITVPVLYTVLAALGSLCVVRVAARSPWQTIRMLPDRFVILLWFFGPIIAMTLLGVGIFNEWRHVLFLYPGFLLLALIGLQGLFTLIQQLPQLWPRIAASVLCAATLLSIGATARWMVRNHPLEFAYFSVPSSWVNGRFETDYWALSYRQAFNWILAADARPTVRIFAAERIAVGSALTLPLEDWRRLEFAEPIQADYLLDVVGGNETPPIPPSQAVHTVSVDGMPLLYIFPGPDRLGRYAPLEP